MISYCNIILLLYAKTATIKYMYECHDMQTQEQEHESCNRAMSPRRGMNDRVRTRAVVAATCDGCGCDDSFRCYVLCRKEWTPGAQLRKIAKSSGSQKQGK